MAFSIGRSSLATLALCVLGAASPAQKAPKETPVLRPFAGKYEAARALAKERNVSLLIHIILDGEAQNDEYRDKILTDTDLIAASVNVVVIISNNGTHAKKTVEMTVDGKKVKKEVCSVFGFDTCALHQQTWDDLYRDFHDEDGAMHCPQTVVIAPDGKVLVRINTGNVPAVTEITAGLEEAVKKFGPGLTDAQLAEVKKLLDEGRNLTKAKAWPDAWRAWQKVLAITQKSPYAEEAQREQPLALAGINAELERISALLVPGTASEGYKQLSDFAKLCAGLPVEKEAQARLKKAETQKNIRDEIAAWKLSVEADALLSEAQSLFDQKQDRRADKMLRRLFGKRYAATPAAAKARELWPAIAAEEDAKNNKEGVK